jgi:hypothetical protein
MNAQKDWIEDYCTLTDQQKELWKSVFTNKYSLYGGGRGPGKSHTLVAVCAYLNMLFGSRGETIEGVIACSTFANLRSRVIPMIDKMLVQNGFGFISGYTKDSNQSFTFSDKRYGKILLTSLSNVEDLRGRNIPYLAIDELCELSEEEFQFALSSVRYAGQNPLPHTPVLATSNPDGIGNMWVYEYFVSKTYNTPLGENFKPYAHQFNYIAADLSHHPNQEYAKQYKSDLAKLPETLKRQWLYGEWIRGEGSRFPFPIREVNPFDIPSHWPRVVGMDWGRNDPSSVVWIAFDDQLNAYVYRELYVQNLSPTELAKEIRRYSGTEPIRSYYADPTLWNKDAHGYGLVEYFRREGINLEKSTNSHDVTNPYIEMYMADGNGYSNLYIFKDQAPQVTKSLQAARWNSDVSGAKSENLIPHSITHAVYSLGYALYQWRQVAQAPNTNDPILEARVNTYWNEQKVKFGVLKRMPRSRVRF